MVKNLQLKGNDLLVYAIIYGFSQNGDDAFTGSLQYLADWCNSSKQGIQKNLSSLCERGLISKEENYMNGVKFCKYRACNSVAQDTTEMVDGMQLSCTNNKEDNNRKEISTNVDRKKKHQYGEYHRVLLTDEEYGRLINDYGKEETEKAITFLDAYIAEKEYKSKSHNLAMRRWVFEAVQRQNGKAQYQSREKNMDMGSKGYTITLPTFNNDEEEITW